MVPWAGLPFVTVVCASYLDDIIICYFKLWTPQNIHFISFDFELARLTCFLYINTIAIPSNQYYS